jgi:hypothetical protein
MVRTASLQYGNPDKEATACMLVVRDVPGRVLLTQWLLDGLVAVLCVVTRHKLCSPPEWMWKLGWGTDDDMPGEPPLRAHSLGRLLYGLFQLAGTYGWRREDEVYRQPVSLAVLSEWPKLWGEYQEFRQEIYGDSPGGFDDEPGGDSMRISKREYRKRGRLVL